MATYQYQFTSSRTTTPDFGTVLRQLRVIEATAGVWYTPGVPEYLVTVNAALTPTQITAVQNVIDTCVAASPELSAQTEIDNWPIMFKAFALALIDQLNVIRAKLPTPLAAITPAQALAAIRAKAGNL